MNRTQDTIILEKIFNERLELSIYKNRGQFYLTKNLRKQFRHKIEINIDVKNQKRLIIKELDEGNVQQNFYSKKLAQHISDLVGVNGNMKFLFIRDEADNCWIGVLLPEMADSYLWGIPIAGAMVNFIVKLYIYIYKMGYSSYFQIPNEYLLINYNITIYNMIIVGSISVVYCMCAVNNVRIILRREMLIKKIFWGILLDFLIPVLICFIILSIATGNWEDALIVLQEERRKCIILVLFIIFSNAIIVFAVGYCMVYSFQKDLIEKNRRNKRKEPKKNLSRKHKYRWKNKDYQLIGWLLIIVAIVFYGAYVNWQGIQNAQKQELFLTTRIDNDTYIVVMTDGDEAILEKDRTGKDGKLKICKDKYMKVDCKNLLLEKKKYRRAIGDGE